jgi:hypothetical protein
MGASLFVAVMGQSLRRFRFIQPMIDYDDSSSSKAERKKEGESPERSLLKRSRVFRVCRGLDGEQDGRPHANWPPKSTA